MKITCQSCQSKYNVADEKVQGKIVKIRCRKCGATIVVQGNGNTATNGSAATAPVASSASQAEPGQWHVNVADGEPRTMPLAALADACRSGSIPLDTFIWTEGMDDWKPVTEIEVVMSAISAGGPVAAPDARAPEGLGAEPGFDASAVDAALAPLDVGHDAPALAAAASFQPPVEEPRRAAVAKRETRGRDLFGSTAGEEVQTSAPSVPPRMPPPIDNNGAGRPTGERNENSVLFSLAVLTKDAGARPTDDEAPKSSSRNTEDSGLIDLKALAAKAESMRPAAFPDGGAFAAPLGFAPPAMGVLGSPVSEPPAKSKLPFYIGAGAGVALLLVLGIVIGVKLGGSNSAAAASAVPALPPPPTAEATPSATPSATASAAAEASATATASVAAKPKTFVGAGTYHPPAGGAKPAGGTPANAANTGQAAPAPPPPPKKAVSDCGCNGDLMCLMKCSTH